MANGPGDRREALFGGKGAVTVWNLLGRTPAPPFTAVLSCELDPGGSVGRHRQVHGVVPRLGVHRSSPTTRGSLPNLRRITAVAQGPTTVR